MSSFTSWLPSSHCRITKHGVTYVNWSIKLGSDGLPMSLMMTAGIGTDEKEIFLHLENLLHYPLQNPH